MQALCRMLLVLVALETLLARWFSHAVDENRPSLLSRLVLLLRGGEAPSQAKGGGA